MAPWFSKKARKEHALKWQRFQSFARWHKNVDTGRGRPFITGYLLRSALIKAVEQELAFADGTWENLACCPGKYHTENPKKGHPKRRSSIPGWGGKQQPCEDATPQDQACPLCLLMNRFKQNGLDNVHFGNLNLPGDEKDRPLWDNPEQIASLRTLNRIDRATTKAQNFFKIYEVADLTDFYGTITVNDHMAKADAVVSLLERGLGFVSTLCGAQCEIRLVNGFKKDISKNNHHRKTDSQDNIISPEKMARICSEAITGPKLRTLADAIRLLRIQDPENFTLPLGRKKQDGSREPHHFWDIELKEKIKKQFQTAPLRTYLEKIADKLQHNDPAYRQYCEALGFRLFRLSKGLDQNQPETGITENIMDPAQVTAVGKTVKGLSKYRDPMIPKYEWIITGRLVARTPFFIPEDLTDNDHTSRKMLLTSDLRYRLPRSMLRGILRRDLHEATGGQGCRAELAPETPCVCPICRVMSRLTLYDAASFQSAPPDIRHRIKIAHHHGIVQDGALFDTEYGLEGTVFPFCLRYRGNLDTIDKDLCSVLGWWKNGLLFIGGDFGSGKGCFELKDLCVNRWNLAVEKARDDYARHCGLKKQIIQNISRKKESNNDISLKGFEPITEMSFPQVDYPWLEVLLELTFEGPVLSADPISALVEDDADTIYFKKRRFNNDGTLDSVPTLRGESFRGLVRMAVARASHQDLLTIRHEDCTCLLCKSFGNEHQAGLIRFEDLELITGQGQEKRLDHVSIDRFDASVVEKFDERALVGSPDLPLVFSGSFWVHCDFSQKEALKKGLRDIENKMYPIGGKCGIGYGWIKKIEFVSDTVDWIQNQTNSIEDTGVTDIAGILSPKSENSFIDISNSAMDTNAIYNPYYFIPTDLISPERTKYPVSHVTLSREQYSGKILCTLKTLSPLLLPDTDNEAADEYGGHKTYSFFKLGDTEMISGAALRSAVSQVYETLTNSCFRVMNQKRTLSWRMETSDSQEYFPGLVMASGRHIRPMGQQPLRLPLYDPEFNTAAERDEYLKILGQLRETALTENIARWKSSPWKKMKNKEMNNKLKSCQDILEQSLTETEKKSLLDGGLDRLQHNTSKEMYEKIEAHFKEIEKKCMQVAEETDRKISLAARNNRAFLDGLADNTKQRVLNGLEKIFFKTINLAGNDDANFQIVELQAPAPKNHDQSRGYLKITGPNNPNIENLEPGVEDMGYHSTWENSLDYSFRLSGPPENRPNTQLTRVYPRPGFTCIKNNQRFSISKRCERVFVETSDSSQFNYLIPHRVLEGYRGILSDYHANAKKIPAAFQTRLHDDNELHPGDLVYYKSQTVNDHTTIIDISPVSISRIADEQPLGQRLPKGFELCSYVCLEDCDICGGKNSPIPLYREGYPVPGFCPACHLFGAQMYKSRVRFSFAKPPAGTYPIMKNVTLPLQERPRPSWIFPKKTKGRQNQIPGRKFYLRHNGWKKIWNQNIDPSNEKVIEEGPNNITVQGVESDHIFTFEVGFENLRHNELGRLLYCLELENPMVHSIGRGKSFGFGQATIKIDQITFRPDSGAWHCENFADKNISETEIVSESLNGLSSLEPLKLMMSPHSSITAYYPGLDDAGQVPGYIKLKNSEYDPEYFLTVKNKDGNAHIYPWCPISLREDQ